MDSSYASIKVIPTILRSYQWYTVSEKDELANLYARITGQEKILSHCWDQLFR